MDFTVSVHNDEDGGFWAEIEEMPGITQADTEQELEANVNEVIELFLEGLIDDYVERREPTEPGEPADSRWHVKLSFKRRQASAKA